MLFHGVKEGPRPRGSARLSAGSTHRPGLRHVAGALAPVLTDAIPLKGWDMQRRAMRACGRS